MLKYNRVGSAGLRVSALGFGTWVTFGDQRQLSELLPVLQRARDSGINHFDTAEAYAAGEAERMLGKAIRRLRWDREELVLCTKLYWGIRDVMNWAETLNRKYLLRSIDGCLQRLGTDYVDILYCHRPDPCTPISEVVWSMSDIVADGKAMYWGTSEWAAEDIKSAIDMAHQFNLRAPVAEQAEFNLLRKDNIRRGLASLKDIGLISYSPLASGLLSGKYKDGCPSGSRGALPLMSWLLPQLSEPSANIAVSKLEDIARRMGYTASQLSIAWCLSEPSVDSVLLGASEERQLLENLKSLEVPVDAMESLRAEVENLFILDMPRRESG